MPFYCLGFILLELICLLFPLLSYIYYLAFIILNFICFIIHLIHKIFKTLTSLSTIFQIRNRHKMIKPEIYVSNLRKFFDQVENNTFSDQICHYWSILYFSFG